MRGTFCGLHVPSSNLHTTPALVFGCVRAGVFDAVDSLVASL